MNIKDYGAISDGKTVNVIITDSDIRSGDDALAIVGYDYHFEIPGFEGIKHVSENIMVSNCNPIQVVSG